MIVDKNLISEILNQLEVNLYGLHGIEHWARVYQNGLEFANLLDINSEIVELFAVFHDSKRISDEYDEDHGHRGAEYAKSLRGNFFELQDSDFDLLYKACQYHTKQINSKNIIIQTCWDADRIDLGRCGIMVDLDYIGTHTYENDEHYKSAYERGVKRDSVSILNKWLVT